MRAVSTACVALLLLAASSLASIHRHHHADSDAPNYGSYIVTSDGSSVTFLNFATPDCSGNFTTFSDPANECGVEFFGPPIARNFSWNSLVNDTHMVFNNFPNPTCTGTSLLSRFYTLNSCEPCPNELCKNGIFAPRMGLGKLSGGSMPWFENHWHYDRGVAFVTSLNAGAVYKYNYNAEAESVTKAGCNATYEPWITGYKGMSGVIADRRDDSVVALATNLATGANELIKFNATDAAAPVDVIVTFDGLRGNLTVNGLARDDANPDVLYVTNLNNFAANAGTILVVDVTSRTVTTVVSNLTAADGAYALNGKLYVSEVFAGRVNVFDISANPLAPSFVTSYVPPGVTSLDDFAAVELRDGRTYIIGADFMAGRIASWPAEGPSSSSEVRIHAAGLLHPTSVRPEFDRRRHPRGDTAGRWPPLPGVYVTATQGGDYPSAPYGQPNNGALYRLRVEPLPTPVSSAGSLVHLSYTDSDCQSAQTTGYPKPLDYCMDNTLITCNATSVEVQWFSDNTCSSMPTNTVTTEPFKCYTNADGTSYMELCVVL